MKNLLGFGFLASVLVHAAYSAERPNIILMMGDDHGWEETGYNGHPHVKTPVLDDMASTGLRLDRFYAGHPSCSPTRGSFLTGRHPNRYGTFAPGWSLRPEEITIAHLLKKAGYRCGHFGKWHVGTVKAGSPTNPGAMGFDEWLSHDNFFELDPWLSRNGASPERMEGESSAVLIEEALRFIDRAHQRNEPFFLIVWFGSPHEPYSGLPEDLELYDDLPKRYAAKQVKLTSNETGGSVTRSQGEVLRERYAEITAMDRAIGTLRRHLADQRLRDGTLLLYCGDNGTSADGLLKSPHRANKGSIYEGGVRVPGLLEWPSRFPKPRASDLRVSTSDLLPTVCGLVGVELPNRPIDGEDVMPLLERQINVRRKPIFLWEYDLSRFRKMKPEPTIAPALQEGTTPLAKLSRGKATRDFLNYRQPPIEEIDYRGQRAVIDGDMKLVLRDAENGKLHIELYDLKLDPAERNDLAAERADIAPVLLAKLRDWQASVLKSLCRLDY